MQGRRDGVAVLVTLLLAFCFMLPSIAGAYLDTMEGPIVKDGKTALEKADVTPVLKWVKREKEIEVCEAFNKAMAARSKGPQENAAADRAFFETLVRLHHEGRGNPFTGIKPAAAIPNVALLEADLALEIGSSETLEKLVSLSIADGIRQRLANALEKKKELSKGLEAEREYADAYIAFVEYVERVYNDAQAK